MSDEIVTRCAPAWAWEVIDDTLFADSQSIAFSKPLREQIENAFEAMLECCEEAPE